MKKILSMLLIFAMVITAIPVMSPVIRAEAAQTFSAAKVTVSSATQSRFQFKVNGVNVASGDTIDMIVNLSDIQGTTTAEGTDVSTASISSITVRDNGSNTKYVDGVSFGSVSTSLGGGWYKVSIPATCASTQLLYTFYFKNSSGTEVFPVNGSKVYVYSISYGSTTHRYDSESNISGVFGSSSNTITATIDSTLSGDYSFLPNSGGQGGSDSSNRTNVDCLKVTATGSYERYQFKFKMDIKFGDEITFFIKPHSTSGKLSVMEDNYKFLTAAFGTDQVVDVGDGWYAVKAIVEPAEQETGEPLDEYTQTYWGIRVSAAAAAGDTILVRDIRINGQEVSVDTAVSKGSHYYSAPTLTMEKQSVSVLNSALTYEWSESIGPSGAFETETFTGTEPTYDTDPYTWKINAVLGGATNLPAVNLAATGRYTNITNVNDALVEAMSTVTFVKPNNMIFIIGDGMGQNDVTLAETYSGNLILNDMPYFGTSSTLSYKKAGEGDGFTTTDSAAGGTALSTGYKTRYYYEALDVDGEDIPQITEVLRERFGKIIGVVTTGWAYDATPAVYGGAHAVRGDSTEIATEMRTFAPDLFIGPGLSDYDYMPSGQDIGVSSNWSAAVEMTNDKIWIDIAKDSTSKDDDVRYNDGWSTSRPTISQLMAFSLTWLQAKSDDNNNVGFFLMFENGMTDDAGHNNELYQMVGEVNAVDEATAIAIKFACENPDTMVIVTADHDTGGMTLKSGWETDISKATFTTGGHSQQKVGVWALGKGAVVFDDQDLYNAQVGKLTAYLMGIEEFGSDDEDYDISDILEGKKNEIGDDTVAATDLIEGDVVHVRADKATDKLSVKITGLSVSNHEMLSLAVKVPAGATSVKIYGADGAGQIVMMEQDLDGEVSYVSEHDYYYLTFKAKEDFTELALEFTGNFARYDEIWLDNLLSTSGTISFTGFAQDRVDAITENTTSVVFDEVMLPYIFDRNIAIGTSLSLRVHAENMLDTYETQIKFTLDGVNTIVTSVGLVGSQSTFVLEEIGPEKMGDQITIELYVNDIKMDVKTTSIEEYLLQLKTQTNDTYTINLINDMLIYGGAAQEYRNHNVEHNVADGVVGTTFDSATVVLNKTYVNTDTTGSVSIVSANLWFDQTNQITFKIKVTDTSRYTVTVNGVPVDYQDMESLGNGVYKVMTDRISPWNFNGTYTVCISEGNTVIATASYSVDSYVYNKMGSSNEKLANLVKALHNYGVSAKAYIDNTSL